MKTPSIAIVCICIMLVNACSTSQQAQHKNLWRFDDPYVNQTIVNGWENIHVRRYEWAALDFTRLIQKKYIDDDILFGAGLAYYFMGDTNKAVEYFTQAIEHNPYHFEAYYFRAQCYMKLGVTMKSISDLKAVVLMEYAGPLVCGYYFPDAVADGAVLRSRKNEAKKLLSAASHD